MHAEAHQGVLRGADEINGSLLPVVGIAAIIPEANIAHG